MGFTLLSLWAQSLWESQHLCHEDPKAALRRDQYSQGAESPAPNRADWWSLPCGGGFSSLGGCQALDSGLLRLSAGTKQTDSWKLLVHGHF